MRIVPARQEQLKERLGNRFRELDVPLLVEWVNLPNMQSSEHRKVDVYAEAIRGLLELERDGDKRAKYIEFIDIYAGLTDNEYRRYQRQYREDSSTMAGVISRAREEGMQRGMEQGRVEGERAVLERTTATAVRPPVARSRRKAGPGVLLPTWSPGPKRCSKRQRLTTYSVQAH